MATDEECPVHGEGRILSAVKRRERLERTRDGLCPNCGERKGAVPFVASGGALDFAHGFGEMWCEVCVVRAQLDHARKRAAEIPHLEEELKRLTS